MSLERLDFVITDRGGARTVSRDISQIGVAAQSAQAYLGKLNNSLSMLGKAFPGNNAALRELQRINQEMKDIALTAPTAASAMTRAAAGLNQVATTARSAHGPVMSLKHAMRDIQETMLTMVGPAAAFVAGFEGIHVLREFSQSLSTTQGIIDTTKIGMEELREQAIHLGETTRFTVTKAADAQTILARSGFNTNQILKATPAVLNTAQAGALDLAQAASIVSNVLRGFRGEVGELNRFMDVLVKAANTSNSDISQMGYAFRYVGPLASALGLDLEQTAAALAALHDAGMQGSMAGTTLRGVLNGLQNPTKVAQRELNRLGISLEQIKPSNWEKNGESLASVLDMMAQKGLTAANVGKVFTQRVALGYLALAAQTPKLKGLTEQYQNAEGAADRMSRTMDDNLNGALLRMGSALEHVVVRVGELGIEDGLRKFFDVAAVAVAKLADIMVRFAPLVQGVGVALALKFIPVGFMVLVNGARTAILGLWAAMLANPLTAIAALIATIITTLYAWRNEIRITSDGFVTLGDYMTAWMNIMAQNWNSFWKFMAKASNEGEKKVSQDHKNMADNGSDSYFKLRDDAKRFVNDVNRWFGSWGEVTMNMLVHMDIMWSLFWKKQGDKMSENQQRFVNENQAIMRKWQGFNITDQLDSQARAAAAARHRLEATPPVAPTFDFVDISEFETAPGEEAVNNSKRTRAEILEQETLRITQQTNQLKLLARERTVQQALDRIDQELKENGRDLLSPEEIRVYREKLTLLERETAITKEMDAIYQTHIGVMEDFGFKQEAINRLFAQGVISGAQYSEEMRKLKDEYIQLKGAMADASAWDVFIATLSRATEKVADLGKGMGRVFGEVAAGLGDKFGDAFYKIAVDGESVFGTLRSLALDVLQEIIKGLIKMGVQWLINKVIATTSETAVTAAHVAGETTRTATTLGSIAATTTATAAAGATIAAAMAPAAAATSLATIGANAAPAAAGMSGIMTLALALFAFAAGSVLTKADGGMIRGPGGPRDDRIPTLLSDGEFVVNAGATKNNMELLRLINAGVVTSTPLGPSTNLGRVADTAATEPTRDGGGGITIQTAVEINIHGNSSEEESRRAGRAAADEFEKGVLAVIKKHTRGNGALAGKK